jgi:NAD-dependent SIR2 family protein deacetylase
MDTLECTNCSAEFRPQDTDVITLRGTASQEMKQYCPYCHTVLSHEVTLGGDELTTHHTALNLYL